MFDPIIMKGIKFEWGLLHRVSNLGKSVEALKHDRAHVAHGKRINEWKSLGDFGVDVLEGGDADATIALLQKGSSRSGEVLDGEIGSCAARRELMKSTMRKPKAAKSAC